MFSIFKQHYIYFCTLFHSYIFSHMFSNNNFQFLSACIKYLLNLYGTNMLKAMIHTQYVSRCSIKKKKYIYIYVCVCVCVYKRVKSNDAHKICKSVYIYIYIYKSLSRSITLQKRLFNPAYAKRRRFVLFCLLFFCLIWIPLIATKNALPLENTQNALSKRRLSDRLDHIHVHAFCISASFFFFFFFYQSLLHYS